MSIKFSITTFAFAAVSAVSGPIAQAAQDHHCKLSDGTYDGTKTEKQCADAKGTWDKDASFTGVLRTDAIGIETQPNVIEVGAQTYELDVHGDKTLLASLKELSGKRVTITGYPTIRKGAEVAEHHFIVVSTLVAAK
jgi:hypothetical protein